MEHKTAITYLLIILVAFTIYAISSTQYSGYATRGNRIGEPSPKNEFYIPKQNPTFTPPTQSMTGNNTNNTPTGTIPSGKNSAPLICKDTDSSTYPTINPFLKGTVTPQQSKAKFTDYCVPTTAILMENYCPSKTSDINYTTPINCHLYNNTNGSMNCNQGACK